MVARMKDSQKFTQLLRKTGLKATPARLRLLEILSKNERPLTVTEIAAKLPGTNQITIYRALVAMVESEIVRKVDMQHAYTHYELVATKKHHHHAICSQCGQIEDVDACLPESLEKVVLRSLKGFSMLTGHSLEFIGKCNQCVR
jgi:Fur family ferric uptake transcriptional regulator